MDKAQPDRLPRPEMSRNEGPAASSLVQLRREFTAYRRERPRPIRVPDALRAGVLAALERGVSRETLRRQCGVSANQLLRWQQERAERAQARVFAVVDDPVAGGAEEARQAHPAQELELRLG